MSKPNVVMDHFQNPRNAGAMEAPDVIGSAGSPAEGGQVVLHLRLRRNLIAEARFQTFGCGYAIAACSLLTEWITGKSLSEARRLTPAGLSELLGGLPEEKLFCAELALKALRQALEGSQGLSPPATSADASLGERGGADAASRV